MNIKNRIIQIITFVVFLKLFIISFKVECSHQINNNDYDGCRGKTVKDFYKDENRGYKGYFSENILYKRCKHICEDYYYKGHIFENLQSSNLKIDLFYRFNKYLKGKEIWKEMRGIQKKIDNINQSKYKFFKLLQVRKLKKEKQSLSYLYKKELNQFYEYKELFKRIDFPDRFKDLNKFNIDDSETLGNISSKLHDDLAVLKRDYPFVGKSNCQNLSFNDFPLLLDSAKKIKAKCYEDKYKCDFLNLKSSEIISQVDKKLLHDELNKLNELYKENIKIQFPYCKQFKKGHYLLAHKDGSIDIFNEDGLLGKGVSKKFYKSYDCKDEKEFAIGFLNTEEDLKERYRDFAAIAEKTIKDDAIKELEIEDRLSGAQNILKYNKSGEVSCDEKSEKKRFFIKKDKYSADLYSSRKKISEDLSYEKRISVLKQMAGGIHSLHSKNLVHGDIKGDNFLMKETVDGSYDIKLTGFGNSRTAKSTNSGAGTVNYTPPETLGRYNLLVKKKYDKKSDIFTLGMTMYETFFGEDHPNVGIADESLNKDNGHSVYKKIIIEKYKEMCSKKNILQYLKGIKNIFFDVDKHIMKLICDMTHPNPLKRISSKGLMKRIDRLGN